MEAGALLLGACYGRRVVGRRGPGAVGAAMCMLGLGAVIPRVGQRDMGTQGLGMGIGWGWEWEVLVGWVCHSL